MLHKALQLLYPPLPGATGTTAIYSSWWKRRNEISVLQRSNLAWLGNLSATLSRNRVPGQGVYISHTGRARATLASEQLGASALRDWAPPAGEWTTTRNLHPCDSCSFGPQNSEQG